MYRRRCIPLVVGLLATGAIACSINSVVGAIAELVPSGAKWPDALTTRDISSLTGPLSLAWTRSDVFARQDMAVVFSASSGYSALAGSENRSAQEGVLVIDSRSGMTLWWEEVGYTSTLLAGENALYAGSPGIVSAYGPDDGRVLWSASLPASRSPRELYLLGDQLDVNTARQVFHILDVASGRILESREYDPGKEIFAIVDDTLYEQGPSLDTLRAVDSASSQVMWTVTTPEAFYSGPTLAGDRILVRTGREKGRVVAYDAADGDLRWAWPDLSVVSNVATLNGTAAFITLDGTLVVVDLASGDPCAQVTFSGGPLALADADLHPMGYHVAADGTFGVVLALLGDSRQLFAFDFAAN